jgi:hypothetical protein
MGDGPKTKGQYSLADIVQGNQPSSGQFTVADLAGNPQQTNVPANPPSAPDRPGFFKRTLQGMGLPSSGEELKAALPDFSSPSAVAKTEFKYSPAGMVYNYGKNLVNQGKETLNELKESTDNVKAGQPILPNIGKNAYAEGRFITRGLLAPVGGNAVQNFGEDIGNKDIGIQPNYPAAAGDATAAVLNALMLGKSQGPSTASRVNKLAFSAGGEAPEIAATLNDLRSAGGKTPETVGDFLQTVKAAKNKMANESGIAMNTPVQTAAGTKRLADTTIVPTDIANRIMSNIRPDDVMTPAGRTKIAYLQKVAADFQKPWTLEQLDSARVQANQRLNPFYKKGMVDQYSGRGTKFGVPIDEAIVQGVQDNVYPAMDRAAGKPNGYFLNLKQRHGNLISLEDALTDRINDLTNKTAIAQGAPRFGTENVSVFGHPTSPPGFSLHRLQNVVIRPNPMKTANAAVRAGFGGAGPVSTGYVYSLPMRYLLFPQQDQSIREMREKAQQASK